jgi:hypothetical protein
MKASEKLIAMFGIENVSNRSKWGKQLNQGGVVRSNEFNRIHELPRRDWRKDYDIEELVELMTDWLKMPKGTMKLWPEQAVALHDLYEHKGLFAPIAVGRGKALISILAATVIGAERPVLFVPAQLREQTNKFVLPEMKEHWRVPKKLKVIGYSEISLAKNANLLFELQPDLLIFDEAHYIKNKNSARTKRIKRYLKQAEDVMVLTLSGTMTRKTILDYWQLINWSLKERAPLPKNWREITTWATSLDSDVPEEKRTPPGALVHFCKEGETPREGYQRRLTETPGVVASGEKELGTSLVIRALKFQMPDVVVQALHKLRALWETPSGEMLTEAVTLWQKARELALGFWYEWDPPAPRDWLKAYKNWKSFVRETLKNNRRALDSELQVWNECSRSDLSSKHPWAEWERIKHIFKPNPVARWISDYAVIEFSDIMQAGYEAMGVPAICWVEHREFGKRLAEKSGYPVFLEGKKASLEILKQTGPIIASQHAHSEGKNLQHNYSCNIITSPSSTGKMWEQIIGRTHRDGQPADEVIVDTVMYTEDHYASFNQALRDAQYTEETLGTRQKLLYANIDFAIRR